MKREDKVVFFKKLDVRMALLVAAAAIIASLASMLIIVPKSRDSIKQSTKYQMDSLIQAYSNELEIQMDSKEKLDTEDYKASLAQAKIEGIESSYAYLVDKTGIMQYHPTAEKIGVPVENSVVKGLVEEIKGGKIPEPDTVEYEFKGAMKYAAYAILSDQSILVLTADEDEILADIQEVTVYGVVGAIVVVIFCMLIGILIVHINIRPLTRLVSVIRETASLNFADDTLVISISKKGDEVGQMAKAILDMRENLKGIVRDVREAGEQISSDISQVNELSDKIREACTDNSATTEELAAGMEETAATTGSIHGNIEDMREGASGIQKISTDGVKLSEEINERALSLRETSTTAKTKCIEMYENIKEQTEHSIKAAECVNQINEMTQSIMQISSQTSLLALNASIEAARAGEAGKGFAVVASEIGQLANETSNSVTSINEIVNQVNTSVSEMLKSMKDSTSFLEDVVIKDYEQFVDISEQYNKDSDMVKDCMQDVENSIYTLTESIASIADAIDGINSTIDESTQGISDIAGKTTDVVSQTAQNVELVEACIKSANDLEDITEKFHI